MPTPDRIVINAQTARHEVQRLVNVAHAEAKRQRFWQTVRRRLLRIGRVAWRVTWRVVVISGAVLAVVAAFILGIALVSSALWLK